MKAWGRRRKGVKGLGGGEGYEQEVRACGAEMQVILTRTGLARE